MSLFHDGSTTNIYSEDWEINVDLFGTTSSSLKSQLPTIKVQEETSPNYWKDLIISESVGDQVVPINQDDKSSINFINYIKERNKRYYWSSKWIVDKGYQNTNNLQFVLTLSNGQKVISKPFQLKNNS